jgi:hypothetical protein
MGLIKGLPIFFLIILSLSLFVSADTCTETDGGANLGTAGGVSITQILQNGASANITGTDYCFDSSIEIADGTSVSNLAQIFMQNGVSLTNLNKTSGAYLMETTCQSFTLNGTTTYSVAVSYKCENGCSNGACIDSIEKTCKDYDFNCDGKTTNADLDVIAKYWQDGTQITMNVVTGAKCENLVNFLAPYWQQNFNNGQVAMNDVTLAGKEIAKCLSNETLSNTTSSNSDLYSKVNADFNCDGTISLEDGTIITDLWQNGVIINSQLIAEKSQECSLLGEYLAGLFSQGYTSVTVEEAIRVSSSIVSNVPKEELMNNTESNTQEQFNFLNEKVSLSISDARKIAEKEAIVNTINLKEKEDRAVYEIEGRKEGKVIALFKTSYPIKYEINTENGTIENIDEPWYSIFIKTDVKDYSSLNLGITGNVVATSNSGDDEVTLQIIDGGPITTIRTSDGLPLTPIIMQDKLTAYGEAAPVIVENKIFMPTAWTYSADYDSVNANFIQNPDAFKQKFLQTNKLLLGGDQQVNNFVNPKIMRSARNNNILSAQEFQNVPFWRATYGGIWELEKVGNRLFGIIHGEHGNKMENGICYQGRIFPEVSCQSCRYEPGIGDCPTSYSSFLAGGYSNNSDGTNFIDEGPIVWPANGYTELNPENTQDAGWGVRHGTSIIKGDYLYLFYQDYSYGDPKNGRGSGMKVARAPLNNAHAGYFETWYRLANGTEGWEKSLPKEFWSGDFYVRDNFIWNANYQNTPQGWLTVNGCKMWNYGGGWLDRLDKRGFQCFNNINDYSIKGGKSTSPFGTHYPDTIGNNYWEWPEIYDGKARYQRVSSFSVAKITGTEYYVGIEDGAAGFHPGVNGQWFNYWLGLRISKDLIHWSDPLILDDTIVSDWGNLRMGHPKILSGDFKTNNEIDSKGFYIIGSHTNGAGPEDWRVQQLNYKWLKISLEGATPPTPTYSCTGTVPLNANLCSGDDIGLTANTARTLVSSCTASKKCEYTCNSDYILSRGSCVRKPTCTSFTYTAWSPVICPQSQLQTRTITSSSPSGCIGGNPLLNQTCTYIPPEICDGIDNDGDGQIDEGCDDDGDGYADGNMECPSNAKFRVLKYSDNYKRTCPTNDWCLMGSENWWSWGNGWIGLNDEVWYNYGTGWISRDIPCSTNSGDIDDNNPSIH